MKNIFIFLITIFGLFAIGCNPMEDIEKDLDKIEAAEADAELQVYLYYLEHETAPEAYTLTDDDYELSSNEDVAKYKNFSANALPKDYLPEILNQKFGAEDAFEMLVTYNFYEKPFVDEDNAYIISDDEYQEMGLSPKYIGFDDEDEAESLIGKLLDRKVYAAEAGTEKTVEYNEYVKNQIRYIKVNADLSTEVLTDSVESYELTETDYDDLGEGYGNFSWIADAEAGVVTLAGLRGHTLPKVYSVKVYRNFFPTYVVYYHDGTNWMVKQSLRAVTEPLNFSLDGENINNSYWWADPAIKITLGSADYDVYPDECSYGNFDLRSGKVPGTDVAKLVEMIGAMLDANHSPVDDQQYLVTYAYYDGINGSASIRIIRTSGVWSEFTEK